MDTAFTHLLAMLGGIADPRRAEGKLYGLPHVFLFSILAVMAGANSYRAIHSFIDVHLHRLKETFELNWRRAPAYTTVRRDPSGSCGGRHREGVPSARADPQRERRVPRHARGRLRRQDVARQLRQVHRHPAGPLGQRLRRR